MSHPRVYKIDPHHFQKDRKFADQTIAVQMEALKAAEQYLMLRSQFEKLYSSDSRSVFYPIDNPISNIMRGCIERPHAVDPALLVALGKRIQELEVEMEEQEQIKKLGAAVEELAKATEVYQEEDFLHELTGTKRKWDAFGEVVKHAQNILDLHKKLKIEGRTDVQEPSETTNTAEIAPKQEI